VNTMPFEPIFAPESTILILGTWPSPKSRETGFYYGHAQNRFWPMLAALYQCETPKTPEAKAALILQNKLALWDVLQACDIKGAADASIKNPVYSDIAALCEKTSVRRILCNGAAAAKLFAAYCKRTGFAMQALQMPSTSPANAACSMQNLQKAWGAALQTSV
jgi:TDG/mug DNA glycosylase family protein